MDKMSFSKPYTGQTWVYLYKHPTSWKLEYSVNMYVKPETLCPSGNCKYQVVMQKVSSFPGIGGYELYSGEIKYMDLYFDPNTVDKDKHPVEKVLLMDFYEKDSYFTKSNIHDKYPFEVQEGYYEIVIFDKKSKELIGKSGSFMVLNGQHKPKHVSFYDKYVLGITAHERLVTGIAMRVDAEDLYKLYITRQMESSDIIEIYVAQTYKRADGTAFLDRGKPYIIDFRMTSYCQSEERVCNIPMPRINYNMGVFFEIYHKTTWSRTLQLRTEVFYQSKRDAVFEAVRKNSEAVGGYICRAAKKAVEFIWKLGRLMIALLVFLAFNVYAIMFTAAGLGILFGVDFLMASIDNIMDQHVDAVNGFVSAYKVLKGAVNIGKSIVGFIEYGFSCWGKIFRGDFS